MLGYCEVVLWVDRKFENCAGEEIPISPVEKILDVSFDYVVVAVGLKAYAEEIFEKLRFWGIDEKKIIFSGHYNFSCIYFSGKPFYPFFINGTCKLKVATKDLFLAQFTGHNFDRYNHSDGIVRYLAAEEYYGKNTYGFQLYRKMQLARIGEDWSERYKNLIRSFEKKSYQKESAISVDRNMTIMDGSHRTMLALYYDIPYVTVEMTDYIHKREYTLDWFWKNKFTREECLQISARQEELINDHAVTFLGTLWPPVSGYFDEIIEDLQTLDADHAKIVEWRDFYFERDELEGIVRGVYSSDDITAENLKKKISFLYHSSEPENGKYRVRTFVMKLGNVKYRVKPVSGQLQSLAVMRIKEIVRKRYQSVVKDYQHDVIIHIPDNSTQSRVCRMIYELDRDISDIWEKIAPYTYAVIKIRDARQSSRFPFHFNYGSDVDILVRDIDIKDMADIFCDYLKQKYGTEEVEVTEDLKERDRKIVVRAGRMMILQIHLQSIMNGIDDAFIMECLANRKNGLFYCLPDEYEYIIRANEYMQNTVKVWHKKYVEEHLEFYNEALFRKAFQNDPGYMNKILKWIRKEEQ